MTQLQERCLVDLLVPGAPRRAACVSAIGHGHLLLTLFGRPADAGSGSAALEYLRGRQVTRVEGRLAPGGDPRALTFEPVDPGVLPQRRGSPRFRQAREVLLEHEGASAVAQVVDLSETGMRFRTADAYRLDDALTVDLETVRGPARILRIQDDGEYALAFEGWSPADRARLRALLAA